MRLYREALIIIGFIAANGIAGWCSQNDEPVYKGIALTALLESAAAFPSIPTSRTSARPDQRAVSKSEAEEGIRQMGTNALPYLLNMIRDEPPARARLAVNAFRLLGPTASPAILGLEKVAQSCSAETGLQVVLALRFIGTNALPGLDRLCTNSNTRAAAVGAVMELGAKGAAIQLFSAEILGAGDTATEHAIVGLRNYQFVSALPIMTNALQHPKVPVRKLTLDVIRQFGAQARPAVPALTSCLYDTDAEVRQATVDLLRSLAPEMFVTNSPARGH